MKFDFVIGNPPYQEKSEGNKPADDSVYSFFMDAAYDVSDKVELITPARFLFEGGNTPKAWNRKMLNDNHFKVIHFESDGKKIFPNTDIKGGVAIHYRDTQRFFGAIEHFTAYSELNSILKKVTSKKELSLTEIIFNQNKFNLSELYTDYPELKDVISSDGKEKRLTSGCINYTCFHDEPSSKDDLKILGYSNGKRLYKWISRKYIELPHPNIDNYKVIVPANNGSGAIGEVISTPIIGTPIIGTPIIGYTQTFISIGAFESQKEAENALKYIKSKFCRLMIGVLKVTQNGKKEVWRFVPIQNFTSESDIDWSVSIADIDKQLYKKYGLSQEEIDFIETNVKEMV